MDLRPHITTSGQLETGLDLIRSGQLFYQPFILADDVEVGEGQNLHDQYKDVAELLDLNAYAPAFDIGSRKQPLDLQHFRRCNADYRRIYEYVADEICKRWDGDIREMTVAEIGCNTGLNLFNMAIRGAKKCTGYDWNNMTPIFRWLNDLLGTAVAFHQGTYNNLYHHFNELDVEEADIMINTVFTNHQCDPLQFLSYLCDRARKGVFLWALVHAGMKEACLLYPNADEDHAIMQTGRPFPLYFYNGVAVSEPLLMLAFARLGFGEVTFIDKLPTNEQWDRFQTGFRMYYAKRTSEVRSAYWMDTSRPKQITPSPIANAPA